MKLSLSDWYPGSGVGLIVSIPDLCPLSYFHVFPQDNIMHNPVFEQSDTLSFALLDCIMLHINGKQFRCSVFTFVPYITYCDY